MQTDRTNNYLEHIDDESRRKEYNMIMCVMRSQRKDTYAAIKRKVYCNMGVPSQVSAKIACPRNSFILSQIFR